MRHYQTVMDWHARYTMVPFQFEHGPDDHLALDKHQVAIIPYTAPDLAAPALKEGMSLKNSLLDHLHRIALCIERGCGHALLHEFVLKVFFEVLAPLREQRAVTE